MEWVFDEMDGDVTSTWNNITNHQLQFTVLKGTFPNFYFGWSYRSFIAFFMIF